MLRLKSYALETSQGPFLNLNEDYVHADLKNNLFYVLDAFGGASIGDEVIQKISECFLKFFTRFGGDPDSTMPFTFSHKYLLEGNALLNSMEYAHAEVLKMNLKREMSTRGGASGIISVISDDILTIASTGNCIAYLLRNNKVKDLVLPDIISRSSEGNSNFPFQTFPLSGFGLFSELHISVKELKLEEGDTILMFSDGVYPYFERDDLERLYGRVKRFNRKVLEEIFVLSNERGNFDNQSAMILHF